jgi:hypothetical protein
MELSYPLAPGYVRWVIVELDDFETTKSNGGTVIDILAIHPNSSLDGTVNTRYADEIKYKWIRSDVAEIGWVLQDKTNILLDTNKK